MTPGWIASPRASPHRRRRRRRTGLAVTLFAITRDDNRDPGQTTPDAGAAETSAAGPSAEPDQSDAPTGTPTGEGDALVGAWTGTASYGKGDRFDVQLDIASPCRLQEPCGTIYVSSTPCTGHGHALDGRRREVRVLRRRLHGRLDVGLLPRAG